MLETKGGNKVVANFWKHALEKLTLLYSHGNAADSGQMKELFMELRAHLRVNIMSLLSEVQHPLEHSWTFCLDNLSANSKQAAQALVCYV
ncbi:hypothetical protein L1987_30196 [Smallanthus sonchifolius]|uniref:Uncharacterized protein n=1 Tax=Smallanthus sonchifolius TaxID=185202 RepID=A0ACB9I2U4_9ASTR|nr:hypothetical protein L1987_30196 [Smallanthus sonchifolius]